MKKKLLMAFIILFTCSISTFLLLLPKLEDKSKYIEPTSIEEIEHIEPVLLDSQGSKDEFIAESSFIVITNKDELQEDRDEFYDDYALASLTEYFTRYVAYYRELEPGIYEASYVDNSYKSPSCFPTFTLRLVLDDKWIYVDCIYNRSTKRYVFKSELNPDRK